MFRARFADGVSVAIVPLTFTVPATGVPLVVFTSVKLAVLIEASFIASEKVTEIVEINATPFAPFAGEFADTVGGVVSGMAAVTKFQVNLTASALPAASRAAVVIVAVYRVLPARLAKGVNLAVFPLTFTVPAIGPPPAVARVKLVAFRVELVIASENVADTEELTGTPVAPLDGAVSDTVGGVVSGAAAVVKLQLKSDPSRLPAASVTEAATLAVYCVVAASWTEGVNCAVFPLTLTVPAIGPPPVVGTRMKLAAFSVELVIALEKVTDTEEFVATSVAAFAGDVADTVGGVVSNVTPVVKFQLKLVANELPATSFTAVVMVAVYWVLGSRLAEGTYVAVLPFIPTTPATGTLPAVDFRVKLAALTVELVTASEKVADMAEFKATPVAPFDGDVSDTIGGVLSCTDAPLTNPGINGGAFPFPPPPQLDKPRLATTAAK